MYSDPTRLRRNVVKLRFSDEEVALINAWVNYTGDQKATLLRELVLSEVAGVLGANNGVSQAASVAPLQFAS